MCQLTRLVAAFGLALGSVNSPVAAEVVRVEHGEAELVSETDAIVPGKMFTVALRLKPDAGWYTQWRCCAVEWTLPEGFESRPNQEPVPHSQHSGYYNTPQYYGHDGEVFLLTEITAPASLEPGTRVNIVANGSWAMWQPQQIAEVPEMKFVLELPVSTNRGADTKWAAAIEKTRAALPAVVEGITVTAYRDGKKLTLVVDADRDLSSDGREFYFFDDGGRLEAAFNFTEWHTARQVRLLVREIEQDPKTERLSGVLRSEGGWFEKGAAFHVAEFAVIDGPPPPVVPLEPLAFAVTRTLVSTPEYRDLRALYLHRRAQGGDAWAKSVYGERLLATLKQLRATAASAGIMPPEQPDGHRDVGFKEANGKSVRLTSIVPSWVETDAFYLENIGNILSRVILEQAQQEGLLLLPPLPPAAQAALKDGIQAAKEQNYLGAISAFETARATPYSPYELYGRRAPEIYLNLGLAEAKLPGRELRAVAWLGAYLTGDPYSPMANQAEVLAQMKVLLKKNEENLTSWLQSVQTAAGKFSSDYQPVTLFQTVILWAEAGDIAAAQKAAALIPVSDDDYCFSLDEIIKAQLRAGDISGAHKTASAIKARYALSVASPATGSLYAGERTEVAYTLATAQVEIAEAEIRSGDKAAGKKTLAAVRQSTAQIRYLTYEALVQPTIAEALIHAGELEEAKAVLAAARKVVDANPESNSKISELLSIARVQLQAGDPPGAAQTFAFAAEVAGPANKNDFARQMAAAQAAGGDIAGAQATLALLTDKSDQDAARLAVVQAQVKRGDLAGGQATALLIENEYDKSRARLALAQAAENRGGAYRDWLSVLEESDRIQDCPLNTAIFTDLAGYLKSLERTADHTRLFENLRTIAQVQIRAKNTLSQMVSELTKK